MQNAYAFEHKPRTNLGVYDDEAFRIAKSHYGIFQLPKEFYLLLRNNNGGTPKRQLFYSKKQSVFTIMTFLYLFVSRGENWEEKIEDSINLLKLLDQHPFAAHSLFPFAKTYAGDFVTYSFLEGKSGRIFLVEPFEGLNELDLENAIEVFSSLDSFVQSAR